MQEVVCRRRRGRCRGKKSQCEGVDIRAVRGLNPKLSLGGSGNHGWSQAEDW